MNKIQGIYGIKNKIDGKIYVGQACLRKGIHRRFCEHKSLLKSNKHYNNHLQNAWNKYGGCNFEFYILEEVGNENNLDGKEQYWIDCVWGWCYNIQPTSGGSPRGRKHKEETKRKIGAANSRRVWSAESRAKLSESQCKRMVTNQTKQQMSASHMGMKHTDEIKRKIGLGNVGKHMTEDSKAKLSLAKMGHKQSDLAIEKQKAAMRLKPTKAMYKGVRKRGNTWQARIAIDGKELYLGSFDNPIDAAKNFDYHSLRLFGDCHLNFPHYDYLTFEPKYRKIHNEFTESA